MEIPLTESLLHIGISASLFFVLFFAVRAVLTTVFGWKRTPALQFASRFVAMTHSLVVGLIAAYDLFFEPAYDLANLENSSPLAYLTTRTASQLLAFPICCGYLLYDNYPQLVFRKEIDGNYEMVFHHWIGIPGLLASLSVNVFGYWVSAMLCFELSTPFLHLLYFLPFVGVPRSSLLYKLNGVIFLITFFVFRVVGSWLVVFKAFEFSDVVYAASSVIWVLTNTVSFAYAVLNSYWFYRIILEARKLSSAPNQLDIGGH